MSDELSPTERRALDEWSPMMPSTDFADRVFDLKPTAHPRRSWWLVASLAAAVAAVGIATVALQHDDGASPAVVAPSRPALAPVSAPPKHAPITARVIRTQTSPDGMVITLTAGADQGVAATGWHGHLVTGTSNLPLAGGALEIVRVDAKTTLARVRLSRDLVLANPNAILEP